MNALRFDIHWGVLPAGPCESTKLRTPRCTWMTSPRMFRASLQPG